MEYSKWRLLVYFVMYGLYFVMYGLYIVMCGLYFVMCGESATNFTGLLV